MARLFEHNTAFKKTPILLALHITVNLWVIHTHLLMPALEMENKAQFLINKNYCVYKHTWLSIFFSFSQFWITAGNRISSEKQVSALA